MSDAGNKWDLRWRDKIPTANWQADPWLLKIRPLLPKGSVLDIASGIGRNAIYLAKEGFMVTAVDISLVALEMLDQEAERQKLKIAVQQLDLENYPILPAGPFDLLLNFFYLHRPLLQQEVSRIRPGGTAVIRTFSQAGSGQGRMVRPEISLRPGELLEIFSGWEVLLHEEGLELSEKGDSLAGIVARRPN